MKITSVQPDVIYQLQWSLEIVYYYLHIFKIIFFFDWRIYNLIVLIDWTTCDIQLVSEISNRWLWWSLAAGSDENVCD